jgi:hypothetical protein
MLEEHESVVPTTDLPHHALGAGDLGTIVQVHQGGRGYTAEFATLNGDTMAVVTVLADQIRPAKPNDMAHVRERGTA